MYKYPCISIQMVIIVVFDQLSYFKRYYTFLLIILTICYTHPIEKTLSGEKHKSVMMQPNGAPRIMNGLRSHIKNSKECFIRYPDNSKSVKKNSAVPRFFNPLPGVWISWWNTLSRVWYITSKCYLAMSISK